MTIKLPGKRASQSISRLNQCLGGGIGSGGRGDHRQLFLQSGKGARVTDIDGNEYIDYMLAFGPLILGHAPKVVADAITQSAETGTMFGAACESELALAEAIIEMIPCAEKVRFTNSGTEAVQAVIRLARAATGRKKIVKFEGHFHGWADNIYVSVKSQAQENLPHVPRKTRMTSGQAENVLDDLIVAHWNDIDQLKQIFHSNGEDIAAVIMEPYPTNNGCIDPLNGYLDAVRSLTIQHGSLLVFDEVVSGFRMAPGGAQARYGVTPDLSTFGKAVAGGMPLAGFAGINKVMNLLDNNAVSHLGTYNSNAICATAALATLRELKKDDAAILNGIRHTGCMLRDGLNDIFHHQQVAMVAHGPGSVVSVYANDKVPKNYRDTLTHNTALLTRFHQLLLQHGVWIFARGNWMLSSAHHQQEIDETLEKTEQVIVQIKLNHAGVL